MRGFAAELDELRACSLIYSWCACVLSLPVHGQNNIRWCAISDQELQKCQDMSRAFSSVSIRPSLGCVNGGSLEGCIEKIEVGLQWGHTNIWWDETCWKAAMSWRVKVWKVTSEVFVFQINTNYNNIELANGSDVTQSLIMNILPTESFFHCGFMYLQTILKK